MCAEHIDHSEIVKNTNSKMLFIFGENPLPTALNENKVSSAIITAVASIIATMHGRTPDKNAFTPP